MQWGTEEYPIKFGNEVEGDSCLAELNDGEEKANDNQDAQASEEEKSEEDDLEKDENNEVVTSPVSKEDLNKVDGLIPTSKTVTPARTLMRTSAAFFRDEETLCEMRRELRQQKKALTNQVRILKLQLIEKEQVAASLQSDLQPLKTSATLANVLDQVSESIKHRRNGGHHAKRSMTPRTAVEWSERALAKKLENQGLAEELVALKTAVQNKQLTIQRKQRQRDELRAKVAGFPRRHVCTLVDYQNEISQLLEEKRVLESQLPSNPVDKQEPKSTTKIALQNELMGLEVTAEGYKEQLRQWNLKLDCEKARLSPLETRLASLQLELQQYEDSQVLLHSVFLQLSPEPVDGCVSLEAALTAFRTLAPFDQDALSTEEMVARLKESSIEQQRISFSQFVTAYDCLCKSERN